MLLNASRHRVITRGDQIYNLARLAVLDAEGPQHFVVQQIALEIPPPKNTHT